MTAGTRRSIYYESSSDEFTSEDEIYYPTAKKSKVDSTKIKNERHTVIDVDGDSGLEVEEDADIIVDTGLATAPNEINEASGADLAGGVMDEKGENNVDDTVLSQPQPPSSPVANDESNNLTTKQSISVDIQDQRVQIHVTRPHDSGVTGAMYTLDVSKHITDPGFFTATRLGLSIDGTSIENGNDNPQAFASLQPSRRQELLVAAKIRNAARRKSQEKVSFLDLPYPVREKIYRQLFVTVDPLNFHTRTGFSRSSNLLRTCRRIHEEGCPILYGENAFHFERTTQTRGNFWEPWKEVGFKDVRNFLEMIGSRNIALLKFVSFCFTDGFNSWKTGEVEEDEKRYVHDPNVHICLNLIGEFATLQKIGLTFSGRKLIRKTDHLFMRALSSIKSYEVIHAKSCGYHISKDHDNVFRRLERDMTLPGEYDPEIDVTKKKINRRRMMYEKAS